MKSLSLPCDDANTTTVASATVAPCCDEGSFPTQRLTWSQLMQIITIDKDLAKLRRSRQDQQVYDQYMETVVRAKYTSVMDFILCTKLNVHSQIDAKTGKLCARREGDVVRKRLVRNDFPYYFETNVEHWILWKLAGEDISTQEIEAAKAELRVSLGDVQDFLHWINPPALKSIPEIDHVHILCRRATTDK